MRITGAVVESPGGPFVLKELELESPLPDEVIVEIRAVGMCHTDQSVAAGSLPVPFPVVLGHEGAGVVQEVGSQVTSFSPGDHVVASFAFCGHCDLCLSGHPAYCRTMRHLNFLGSRPDGTSTVHCGDETVHANFFGQSSFATHSLCREQHLIKIDDDVPFEIAAPLGCGFQTGAGAVLNVLKPSVGDSFAVFGGGAVGLAALLAAKACGAAPTIVVEPVASRRALAVELGASAALDPTMPGLLDALNELSSGGLSSALDTSANLDVISKGLWSLETAWIPCSGHRGRSICRYCATRDRVFSGQASRRSNRGGFNPAGPDPYALTAVERGRVPIDHLCRIFPFSQINEAAASSLSGEVIKPVLQPESDFALG